MSDDVIRGWGNPIRFSAKGASEYIPTWQKGQAQPTPNDFHAYLTAGYQHSVIYSCVREIATSFADLPPAVVRPTPDGDESVASPALELLARPNEEMDAYEFLLALATHYQTTGNVYIEKVRVSAMRERARLPVKELGLIRPDRVEIRPGNTRAEDVFVVSVDGHVVKVLPRADVIHIRTANPGNDFYGLSPIAVAAQVADLDKLLTDFDSSFFRNAGVPMGILKTKTRHSPDELNEIKGAFKRSFSGLRKWFEVLVLNSEEADYQQMGAVPKDMEMTASRDLAESRICAIYGVPPILVGLLVGLTRATYSNYEQAQFSFWSETMVPFAGAIGAALTRELLPEFQTSATRGARVVFDTSGVKALQEDATDRLKGAAALVMTGGWTVNQALDLHGLPMVADGDFYVRQLTQVIDVSVPQRSAQRIEGLIESPAPRRLDRPVEAAGHVPGDVKDSRVTRDRLQSRFEAALESFFGDQAARVASRLPKGAKAEKVLPDDLLPAIEDALLRRVIEPYWTAGARNGWEIGAGELGVSPEFPLTDPRVRRLIEQAGDRVTGINETTREQIQRALGIGRDEGLAPNQIAQMLRDLPAFNASRAETVARTELAIADNAGAIERYRDSGLVDEVDIIDGPDCGWTSHDDGDLANGSRRSLDDFQDHVISHPRCVRSRSPVIRGD